uniref:[phosphatase 2A protein]-leucine-carboxy methyltransferase n=1 Tax=Pelagomonas calceolata TaxID=35677 RepID=A0A7S3ZPT2_9STRA
MAEELASIIALCYAPTPQKTTPQNAVEATAAVSLRAKAAVPQHSLAYDVASPVDAQLWQKLPTKIKGRPADLALRFAHVRMSVVRRCADRAVLELRQGDSRVRVVSLGAGLDGECLRLATKFEWVDCVELDLEAVAAQKRELVSHAVLSVDDDLAKLEELLGDTGPTLILAEVSLCYASPEAARRARRWAASLKRACYLELTPTSNADSRFGLALQSGFGTLLRCAPRDADDLATTLRSSGFAHSSILDLDAARRRLGVLQTGADEAALTLALRRYVMVVASADASLARGIMQRPEVVVRKMEAADSTHAKDAYIAAMGCDGAIRKHAKKQCVVLDTLPAFVATLNASIVGAVALDDQGEVRCLGVVPSLRRLGAASQLMMSIEAAAFRRGFEACTLRVPPSQQAAVALYAKRGYSTREDPRPTGAYPTIYLEKDLSVEATLVATPLIAQDASKPKVLLEKDEARFALPDSLFPTMGLVVSINGERFVCRRDPDPPSMPTLSQGTRVSLDIKWGAAPAWAWPRRVRSYAPVAGSVLTCDNGHSTVDGPCACNAECCLS